MRKVTLWWTLSFTVLLSNETGGQLSMIGKQLSQLWGIGRGGGQCGLPSDFPAKFDSRIYFIGIRLLMCSWKLCCVLHFGDFCSWKRNFGVGMHVRVQKLWSPPAKESGAISMSECSSHALCAVSCHAPPLKTQSFKGLNRTQTSLCCQKCLPF